MRAAKCAAAALPGSSGWHQPWSNPTPCTMHVFLLLLAAAADATLLLPGKADVYSTAHLTQPVFSWMKFENLATVSLLFLFSNQCSIMN